MILRRFDLSSFSREIKTFLYKWNYTTEKMVKGLWARILRRFIDTSIDTRFMFTACVLRVNSCNRRKKYKREKTFTKKVIVSPSRITLSYHPLISPSPITLLYHPLISPSPITLLYHPLVWTPPTLKSFLWRSRIYLCLGTWHFGRHNQPFF